MSTSLELNFTAVYGPVNSWRYGRSLGIDPIGNTSRCSFNCVYCQLGEIVIKTQTRDIFVPTEKIIQDLSKFEFAEVDMITLSGSGEPTLALNLGDILAQIKETTGKPTLVLTNGTLLQDAQVRKELAQADQVSVKLDAINEEQLTRIDRPVSGINLKELIAGITQFSTTYPGNLAIQTMILAPWDELTQTEYIRLIQAIAPHEIQLNIPKRPKPLKHEFDSRGNHTDASDRPYPVRVFKCVSNDILQALKAKIEATTHIPVRLPPYSS